MSDDPILAAIQATEYAEAIMRRTASDFDGLPEQFQNIMRPAEDPRAQQAGTAGLWHWYKNQHPEGTSPQSLYDFATWHDRHIQPGTKQHAYDTAKAEVANDNGGSMPSWTNQWGHTFGPDDDDLSAWHDLVNDPGNQKSKGGIGGIGENGEPVNYHADPISQPYGFNGEGFDPDEKQDPFDPRLIGAALRAVKHADAIMRLSGIDGITIEHHPPGDKSHLVKQLLDQDGPLELYRDLAMPNGGDRYHHYIARGQDGTIHGTLVADHGYDGDENLTVIHSLNSSLKAPPGVGHQLVQAVAQRALDHGDDLAAHNMWGHARRWWESLGGQTDEDDDDATWSPEALHALAHGKPIPATPSLMRNDDDEYVEPPTVSNIPRANRLPGSARRYLQEKGDTKTSGLHARLAARSDAVSESVRMRIAAELSPPCPDCGQVAGFEPHMVSPRIKACRNCGWTMTDYGVDDLLNETLRGHDRDIAEMPETDHPTLGKHGARKPKNPFGSDPRFSHQTTCNVCGQDIYGDPREIEDRNPKSEWVDRTGDTGADETEHVRAHDHWPVELA